MTELSPFDFLKYSLSLEVDNHYSWNDMEWQGLYRFGKEQALLGVLYEGIKRLPNGVFADEDLLAKWTVVAHNTTLKNQRINAVAVDLCQKLADDGWRYCVLKGQGNTINYPNPNSRAPGDIDIWLVADKTKWSQGEAYPYRGSITSYISETFGEGETRYYHTEFDCNGVSVEAHYMPGIMNCPWYNHRLQEFYQRNADLQCSNIVELPDNAGSIAIPTVAFNLIYQLAHLYHHFFDEGIGFRQMVDYYQLLVHNRQEVVDAIPAIRKELRYVGLYDFAGAVMWVLQETLGLDHELMIGAPDERRGKVLLEEILNGGNFGKYDKKYGGLVHQSTMRKYFTKVRRSLTFVRLYPSEAICEPLFRTWHFFWRLTHKA